MVFGLLTSANKCELSEVLLNIIFNGCKRVEYGLNTGKMQFKKTQRFNLTVNVFLNAFVAIRDVTLSLFYFEQSFETKFYFV